MRVIFIIIYILILCLSCLYTVKCSDSEDEFVDPLDMLNYDRLTKSMKKPMPKKVVDETFQNDQCTVFLSRFINILLMNTGLSNIDQVSNKDKNEQLKLYALVNLSVEDLQLLKSMAYNRNIDYTEIDRILNGLFTPVKMRSSEFEEINSHSDMYDQIKQVVYWILVGSISILILYVVFHKINLIFSLTFVLFIIFSLAFASTWYTMYMKAEINRSVHLEYMPTECQGKTGGWSSFSWFSTNNLDKCKKYKEAIFLDPKFSIALTDILAEMLSKMMMKPIEALGESIYVFNKSVLKDIPYWAQIFLIPLVIIIVIKTIFLSSALLVGRSLSTSYLFGYDGNSTIGPTPSNNNQLNTKNKTNNSFQPTASVQNPTTQISKLPNINFNINLLNPSPSPNRYTHFSIDDTFKMNNTKHNNLIAMLKNKEIDSVDSKGFNDLMKKVPRHRTLSI